MNIISLTSFFTQDDKYHHSLVATGDGKLFEVFHDIQRIGRPLLECFNNIFAVAGYFTVNDGNRHAIVATSDGYIYEIHFNPQNGIFEAR